MKRISALLLSVLLPQVSSAIPLLQLDIAGGVYDPVTETIIAGSNPFTVYALFYNEGSGPSTPSGTYRISAAIIPQTANPPVTSFGSFTIDGTAYSAANMTFGTPPIEAFLDSKDLPSHGIFETHYAEVLFTFNLSDNATPYNSQDNPGGLVEPSSGALYYHAFTVNIAGIAAGYNVHFDFYNTKIDPKTGTIIIDQFAPFSHDAQGDGVPDTSSTLTLLGLAMIAVEGFRRRFAKSSRLASR